MNDSISSAQYYNENEMDLVKLVLILWNYKYLIIIWTILITSIGVTYVYLATPSYKSTAIIAPKEMDNGKGGSSVLATFGDLGGFVGSQLGLGSGNLDKIEIILKSHELAKTVINKNHLMPRLYPDQWDSTSNSWLAKDSSEMPDIRFGIELLSETILKASVNSKKNIINISAETYDAVFSKEIVQFYLDALNRKLLRDVKRESSRNISFLERQLNNTLDPILREKVSNLIAFEIEKNMLVSTQSFDILVKPEVPITRSKPKKKMIVVLSFTIGVLMSIVLVFLVRFVIILRQRQAELKILNK